MSIFGSIMSAIFGSAKAQTPGSTTATPGATATPGTSGATVDVDAVVSAMAAKKTEKLNWKTSIVDLMKVLDLDSSLTARKELAKELNYTGETNGSAEMNIWLHKQVMKKLAENGGKVPADLKD